MAAGTRHELEGGGSRKRLLALNSQPDLTELLSTLCPPKLCNTEVRYNRFCVCFRVQHHGTSRGSAMLLLENTI